MEASDAIAVQEMPVNDETDQVDEQMPALQPVSELLAQDTSVMSPVKQLPPPSLQETKQKELLAPEPVPCIDQPGVPVDTDSHDTQEDTAITPILCAACQQVIKDRFLLQALDHYWHEDCLKCSCCDCRLGEVGATLYTKANLLLCKRDYLRLFGTSGTCTICKKSIPAFEMVMKVKNNVYHLECFACQQCRQRFCVGDKFYLCENRILCEYDFEEQNLITSIQRGYNTLSHMRRQTETLSDISSGYGSPSPGTL